MLNIIDSIATNHFLKIYPKTIILNTGVEYTLLIEVCIDIIKSKN